MASQQETYMLSRDKEESGRLDIQQEMFAELAGGHPLDPAIPPDTVHVVADVAAGTGAWLRHVASLIESYPAPSPYNPKKFVAFDISDAQFPKDRESIGDLEWVVHDVTKPFPKQYYEMFDVVHVRLLSFALKSDAIGDTVKNVAQLLKPGGYLQWQEGDLSDIVTMPESEKVKRILMILLEERKARGLPPTISQPLLRAFCDLQLHAIQTKQSDLIDLLTFDDVYALRVMHVCTQSTSNHPSELVNRMTGQVIGGGVKGLLKMSAAARRKAWEASKASDVSQQEQDQLLELAEEAEALVDDSCFVTSRWDMEYVTVVARRAVVVSMSSLKQGENKLRYPRTESSQGGK